MKWQGQYGQVDEEKPKTVTGLWEVCRLWWVLQAVVRPLAFTLKKVAVSGGFAAGGDVIYFSRLILQRSEGNSLPVGSLLLNSCPPNTDHNGIYQFYPNKSQG